MKREISPGIHAAAGAMGGVLSLALTYPLIVVATLQQLRVSKEDEDTQSAVALVAGRDLLHAVTRVLARMGWRRLYAGFGFALVAQIWMQFLYFWFFSAWKRTFIRVEWFARSALSRDIATSVLAGATASILCNPLWVANARAASEDKEEGASNLNVLVRLVSTIRRIARDEGLAGLCSGIGPSLVLVSNPVIQFTASERFKSALLRLRLGPSSQGSKAALTPVEVAVVASAAKALATVITYPYFTARTRAHANHGKTKQDLPTAVDADASLWCLYRGMGAKMTQSILTAVLLFVTHDRAANLLCRASERLPC